MTQSLKERLETGPGSRELSDEFLLACGWLELPHNDDQDWVSPHDIFYYYGHTPNPTLDINAAMELVPDGWLINGLGQREKNDFSITFANGYLTGANVYGRAPTLALAICAAVEKISLNDTPKKTCKYGDPICPCQDGDMCHYEGPDAWEPPSLDLSTGEP